jgi:catechol 2,3-dioxygenase-like lactoylglutathione lyase family enzyme
MEFLRVRLRAARAALPEVTAFYGGLLGLEQSGDNSFRIGATELEFLPDDGEAFYHFALLVPGDRFDAAFEWIRALVELLPYQETGEEIFDFDNWDALACYFHDPAGNILELIAHHGVGEQSSAGGFEGRELLGFSELGLVGDTPAMARELEQLELYLWDGTVEEPGNLAFVGEKARTLILSPEGRGWLPTGRAAEPHPVAAILEGPPAGEALIGGVHRISREA